MLLSILSAATLFVLSEAQTQIQGFNYGAVTREGAVKTQSDFEAQFSVAKGLADGAFTSARLYTGIQPSTQSTPISAIAAAISTKTKLLLGMWASSGNATIQNEITALQSACQQYGSSLAELVTGISVGNEDLYRITPTGLMNDPLSVGAQPDEIVNYISQVRIALKDTVLNSTLIGHVDTWTAWVNGTNSEVIKVSDFLGMNTFPYYQTTDSNSITDAKTLFDNALSATQGVAGDKPVWVTETGWPVQGNTSSLAIPSIANAQTYWDQVGCSLFGKTTVYWYTLVDENTDVASQPEFGVVGTSLSSNTLYNLTCPASTSTTSTSLSSTSAATVASGSSGGDFTSAASSQDAAKASETAKNGSAATTYSGSLIAALVLGVTVVIFL